MPITVGPTPSAEPPEKPEKGHVQKASIGPSDQVPATLPVKKILEKGGFSNTQESVSISQALQYLQKSSDWHEPFFELLLTQYDEATQERTLRFLAPDKEQREKIVTLAKAKEYAKLAAVLLTGQELVGKLLGTA